MHTHTEAGDERTDRDPLGLGDLPWLEPDRDGWPAIKAALQADAAPRPQLWRRPAPWLAAAASVALALLVVTQQGREASTGPDQQPVQQPAVAQTDTTAEADTLDSMIAMSQSLEHQLRDWRERTVTMPAQSAVYVAELEDLVAQVDQQLSYSPDSVNLWGQRINLLLDLAQIYQQQWERDYGLMASL